jgi:hypothetical protein
MLNTANAWIFEITVFINLSVQNWEHRPDALKTFETMSLQWARVSALQSVAVEDLLRAVKATFGDDPRYRRLLPAMADVADVTSLQCNRAVASAYFACKESRIHAAEELNMPRRRYRELIDAPLSNVLFERRSSSTDGEKRY